MKNEYLEAIVESLKKNKNDVAIVDKNKSYSYNDVYSLALKTANYLKDLKLDNHIIPIMLDSGYEYIAINLGIWLLGYTAVPMGLSFPLDRVEYILSETKASILIDNDKLKEILKADEIKSYEIVSDDTLALIIYTSGSTGNPKGIMQTFRGLNKKQTFKYDKNDAYLALAPFYFVASLTNFKILRDGAKLHIPLNDVKLDIKKIEKYVCDNNITHMFIPPSVLKNFTNKSKSLKVVYTGSEKLTNEESRDGYTLINCYGMTETLGTVSSFKVNKKYDATPVGKPEYEWCLLDDDGKKVSKGSLGELCIKGNFTIGYFNDPVKTKELIDENGFYHTKDLLRELPSGDLVYVNRKDWMVKINGQRVEVGEVETRIKDVEGIQQAVVKGFENKEGGAYLCAFYKGDVKDTDIKEYLSKLLPPYMIPLFFVKVKDFSYLTNGKINRKVLAAPDVNNISKEYVAPVGDVEKAICKAYEEVFSLNKCSRNDDFFLLGGDSIKVMKLATILSDLNLSSKTIYKEKTPKNIAKALKKEAKVHFSDAKKAPLSYTQLGIYTECMMKKGEALYNNPILFKLDNKIDINKLAHAIEDTLKAHKYINVHILEEDSNPYMELYDLDYKQEIENITNKDLDELKNNLIKPFDLATDRLFRIRLFKTEDSIYMFTDFHHIIYDGTSMKIFMDDLALAYNGTKLKEESYSILDISLNEENLRKTDVYSDAKKWYLDTFKPIDLDSKPLPDLNISEVSYATFERNLFIDADELEQLSLRLNVTLNIVTMGAFAYLLSLYKNENEALFTTIYNGRSDLVTDRTMAMMVKTLPVYAKFDDKTRVSDYLNDIKNIELNAMNNDIYSFLELAGEASINSDVLFAYQGDYLTLGKILGYDYKNIELTKNATGGALNTQVYKNKDKIFVRIEYKSNEYSKSFIEHFMNSYEAILNGFMEEEKIASIGIVNDDELKLLDSFNKEYVPYDDNLTIVDMFINAKDKYLNNDALYFKDIKLSYKELYEYAYNVATMLKNKNIKRGDVVSILIPRCELMPILGLASMMATATYQPLDATYPEERLNFMVNDSSAKILITTSELKNIITDFKGEVIIIDKLSDIKKYDVKLDKPKPSDIMILLYTSGSTGIPKGVKLSQENICAFINFYKNYFKIDEKSICGAYASFGFDANMMDTYPTLVSGAALCILPEELRLDLTKMDEYFTKYKVSHLFLTTQVGRQYGIESTNPYLKYLSMGGEKLIAYPISDKYSSYNLYGPTECSVIATYHKLKNDEKSYPIGYILDNLRGYIVNKYNHRLPVGAIGELIISGKQVGMGYLNRDDKTKEVFIKNPYSCDANYINCYKTGDVVRYMENGEIEFVGRADGQVKIRGFRIELSEVEEVIRGYKDIKDVALKAFDHPGGGKYLCAYLVSDKKIDLNDLKKFILDRKPPYMVPQAFVNLDKIPLNQNGKVNRKALEEPKMEVLEDKKVNLNALEEKLKEIALNVLKIEDVSISQSLYDFGLTSILSIKLLTMIYKEFNIDINPSDINNDFSIISLENFILKTWMEKGTSKNDEVVILNEAPLSYPQTGVYFECIKNPSSLSYNIPSLLKFNKNIDLDLLKKALNVIISSHKEINAHFIERDGNIIQVYNNYELKIDEIDINDDNIDNIKNNYVKPFDLHKGPLARFIIMKSKNNIYLFNDFHHLVFDGASMQIYIKNLEDLLNNKEIEAEKYSYFNYVIDQKNNENSSDYKAKLDYFKDMFKDFENQTELSNDINLGGSTLELITKPFDFDSVLDLSKKINTTPAQIILAALYYTVSRYVNDKNIYISTISNGRSDLRLSNLFGMFVNTIPLHISIKDMSVKDFINEAKLSFINAIANETFPFAKINELYKFSPSIVYEYQLGVIEKINMKGLEEVISLEGKTAKFKLAIHIENKDNKPSIVVYYNRGLYSYDLMESFAESIKIVLNKLINNLDESIIHIDMLDDIRKAEIEKFSKIESGPLSFDLYHKGVEIQAEKLPNKLALVACDRKLTFKEFNDEANKIAHSINDLKIRNEKIIILLPRTSDLITSIFGVLKSGNAYIPCDPNYPKERINLILEDSDAKLIITTKDRLKDYKNTIDVKELLNNKNTSNLNLDIKPTDLAYLIYTSGSTGRPKGVMLMHKGVSNYCSDFDSNIYVKEVKKVNAFLAVTTISFDMSVKEIGTPLTNGITVVLAKDESTNNPNDLAKLMLENNVDGINATPSRLKQYLEIEEFSNAVSKCKFVVSGGEKYPIDLLEHLKSLTNATIMNTYGPTEISVSCNMKNLTNENKITVGKPLYNVIEYVVDSDGNILPKGVVGELYIGGVGVAKGYHNLEDKTKASFIKFRGMDFYKSGDYSRWDSEGNIEILGRTDNQIKLRGLRIELGEIESALAKVDGIKSGVIKIVNISGVEHLCCYYTTTKPITVDELKSELSKTLTKYMVPTAYLELKTMPLTPNGKIDVKNLPMPVVSDSSSHEEAKNELEKLFVNIFKEILNSENVGATDSFFDIGGTSLSAIRITVLAAKEGYNLTYSDIFKNSTPRALASMFGAKVEENDNSLDSEIIDYDYSKINKLLENNNLESFKNGTPLKLGNILLTGPIGYLGIHILNEYLNNYDGIAYCLLRGKGDVSSYMRLKSQLFYYFENSYDELFNKRIIVIDGDITKKLNIKDEYLANIDTIINCAAVVKHFSAGTEIEDVNVGGVKNLVDFAIKNNKKFIQVSTASTIKAPITEGAKIIGEATEQMLYLNQILNNKYVRSKFIAERIVLEAIESGKLTGKIMRVGNLAPRDTDGEFQINFNTNSAMGRIKSFAILGNIPFGQLNQSIEFSPIDNVAKAILKLIATPKECVVFHPLNDHKVLYGDILKVMRDLGIDVKGCEREEFVKALTIAESDEAKSKVLTSMLAYKNNIKEPHMPLASTNYTMQVLYRLGFDFAETSNEYIKKFMEALIGLGFFEV